MNAWIHLLKARILLFCSLGVVLIGLAPLLYLVGLAAWQFHIYLQTGTWITLPASLVFTDRALLQGGSVAPVLAFIPHPGMAWSTHDVVRQIASYLHIGVIPGLVGLGLVAVGISSLLRQRTLIRIHKERRKALAQELDNQRREASRADAGYDGRREPVIGPTDFTPAPANDTPAPAPAAQTSAPAPAPLVAERNSRVCRQTRGRPIRRRAAA